MAFIEVVTGDPELQPTMAPLQERIDRILGDLRGGDAAGGARRFVERRCVRARAAGSSFPSRCVRRSSEMP